MTHFFLECGTTLHSAAHTGIQRVVRNILREAERNPPPGHSFQPVQFAGGRLLMVPPNIREKRFSPWLKRNASLGLKSLGQTLREIAVHTLPHAFLRAAKAAALRHYYRIVQPPCVAQDAVRAVSAQRCNGGEMPVLLLLDSSWYPGIWEPVEQFRAEGGHVSAVLYDLIPFSHPETVQDVTREAHTHWWRAAPGHLDSLMCISRTVRDEFLAWQETLPPGPRLSAERVGYFHLGSELPPALARGTKASLVPEGPYFLTVGTLEPRKNHHLILDAFDGLWESGSAARLVIVGVFGWKSESLLARIQSHPALGKKLFHIDKASDQDLAVLYDGATAVIAASLAEGFGLPVVEAHQRGARVLCSDIPVFREIAGSSAVYFDPFAPESLAEAVRRVMAHPPAPPPQAGWIGWKESAHQLFTRLDAIVKAAAVG